MKKLARLLLLGSTLVTGAAAANDLAVMGQLAKDGAPGLALALMDQAQPNPEKNVSGWLFFEQQRIEIMRDWQQWSALEQRLAQLPEQAPAQFRQWAGLQRADAQLQLNRPEQALQTLRQLIWQPQQDYSDEELALYRRLIIRAYMLSEKLEDARRAINRYEQDYGAQSAAWKLLQARVFLLSQRPQEALQTLQGVEGHEAQALRWLAELRVDETTFTSIVGRAREQLNGELSESERARYWLLIAEAGALFETRLTRVKALEQAVLLRRWVPAEEHIFSINADKLWQAYRDYGQQEGNREQLLVGDDPSWLAQAESAAAKHPAQARGLYAVVMQNSYDAEQRLQAQQAFAASFGGDEQALELLAALYTESSYYPSVDDIPRFIRYRLIDRALARADVKQAAWLMQGLTEPPEQAGAFEWNLRRARVTILSGDAPAGVTVLEEVLQQNPELSAEDIDRVLQVIFDLQTVQAHDAAIALLSRLLKRPLASKQQREILFWLADSWKAQDNTARAAAYYLRSATLLDGRGLDPWGQTARFQAATVLLEGDILDDAQRMFEALLNVTADPNRRAVIRNKLQEISLRKNHRETVAEPTENRD